MKRRDFLNLTTTGIAAMSIIPSGLNAGTLGQSGVRLGGPVFE
jgi:hypothetical protein